MHKLISLIFLLALIGCENVQEQMSRRRLVCLDGVVYYAFGVESGWSLAPKFTRDSKVLPCEVQN